MLPLSYYTDNPWLPLNACILSIHFTSSLYVILTVVPVFPTICDSITEPTTFTDNIGFLSYPETFGSCTTIINVPSAHTIEVTLVNIYLIEDIGLKIARCGNILYINDKINESDSSALQCYFVEPYIFSNHFTIRIDLPDGITWHNDTLLSYQGMH